MWVSLKKQMEPIYQRLDKIAKGGSDNIQEYFDYVDELIQKESYGLFQMCLYEKYGFNSVNYPKISMVKPESWKHILHKTNSRFQQQKYQLLKSKLCYQTGLIYYQNFTYSLTASVTLGKISEHDAYGTVIDNELTSDEFQKVSKNKTTWLDVTRFVHGTYSSTQSASFSTWRSSQTYDKNLLNLYSQAITYLI